VFPYTPKDKEGQFKLKELHRRALGYRISPDIGPILNAAIKAIIKREMPLLPHREFVTASREAQLERTKKRTDKEENEGRNKSKSNNKRDRRVTTGAGHSESDEVGSDESDEDDPAHHASAKRARGDDGAATSGAFNRPVRVTMRAPLRYG